MNLRKIIDTTGRALWWLGYSTHNRVMDAAFGCAEPFEFTGSTMPADTEARA